MNVISDIFIICTVNTACFQEIYNLHTVLAFVLLLCTNYAGHILKCVIRGIILYPQCQTKQL